MNQYEIEISIEKEKDGTQADILNMSESAARSMAEILHAMSEVIALNGLQERVKISLVSGSVCSKYSGQLSDVSVISDSFNKYLRDQLEPSLLKENIKRIHNLVHKNGLAYKIYTNVVEGGVDLTSEFKAKKVRAPRTPKRVKKVYFIKGVLYEIGGLKPNFHVHDSDGNVHKIACTEYEAQKAIKFLYKEINVSAFGTDTKNCQLIDVYDNQQMASVIQSSIRKEYETEEIEYYYRLLKLCSELYDQEKIKEIRRIMWLNYKSSHDYNVLKSMIVVAHQINNEKAFDISKLIEAKIKDNEHSLYY